MATPIDVSFRADISNLTKQLATLPGMTKKEAKEMVKGLESEIKKAEKAAIKAAKNTEKAWGKTGGQFKRSRQATNELSDGMRDLKDQSGETDSVLKAFGGAIGTISPEAERAFMVLGDLSGGVEALARSSVGLIGPIALVTAAVGAGVYAWNEYSEELEAAEQNAKDMAEATEDMARVVKSLSEAQDLAKLKMSVALGQEENEMLLAKQSELAAEAQFREKLQKDLKRENEIRVKLRAAKEKEAEEFRNLSSAMLADADAHTKASKEVERLQNRLEGVTGITEGTRKKQQEYASTLFVTAQAQANSSKATKNTTKATKDQEDAIGDLIEKVAAFDAPVSELEQMGQLLEVLTDEALENQEAFDRLQPAIGRLVESMERVEDTEAAKELEKLSQEAGKFGQATDPIVEAAEVLARLKAEAEKSGEAFEALAPDIQRVGQHLEDLKIAEQSANRSITGVGNLKRAIGSLQEQQKQYQAIHGTTSQAIADQERQLTIQMEQEAQKRSQAYQMAFNNMAAAGAQFAQLRVNQIQKGAQEELEGREHIGQGYEDGINSLNQAISQAETEAEKERLEQMRSNLEKQLEAEEEAQEKIKEKKDAEILKAFRVSQAFNISQALMNSAVAATKAIADLGPVAGPIAAGSMAALAAAQVATIAAQEPPTAHMGGMVGNSDEKLIKARTGEGVLTAQGVQAIGGAQGVANANAGMSGPGGQIVIQQVYRHRVLDTVIQDSINKGGPITQAINRRNKRGRRNPYRRSG